MRWLTGLLFLLVAALPFLARLGDAGAPPPPAGSYDEQVVIFSPHRREVKLEYDRAFPPWAEARTGRRIGLLWLDAGGGSTMMKTIESRFARTPDSAGADLIFGGGPSPFHQAVAQGWAAPAAVPPEVLAAIPPTCAGLAVYDPQRRWFGVALSGFGILYCRPILEQIGLPPPRTWADLARPEYFTWLGSGDPRRSGSVHVCYEVILQAHGFERGWGLLTRLAGNVRSFGEGGGTVPREVMAGEVAAGMVIDQYARTVIAEVGGDALAFVLPEDGTVISPDPIGLLRGAPHREAAELFIRFTLSAAGQRLLYRPPGVAGQRHRLFRLPVRADLYGEPHAPARSPYETEFEYSMELQSRRWGLLNDLVGTCLIDAHADLVSAWGAVIRAGSPPELVARLCEPPLPAAGQEAASAALTNPRERQRLLGRWGEEARRRYAAVRRAARRRGAAPAERSQRRHVRDAE